MEDLNKIFSFCKKDMQNVFLKLKKEIHTIRLGSKSVAYSLSNIKVKCYGAYSLLLEVSNITTVDNMNIIIKPWDKTILSQIEKSIIDSNLGVTPTNRGDTIHILIPVITEEGRKNIIKNIKIQSEKAKVHIRNIRKKNNNNIKKLKISKDIYKKGEIHIQIITDKYTKKIDEFFLYKENEILKI